MKAAELEKIRKTLLARRDELRAEAPAEAEPTRRDPTSVGTDEDEQPLAEMSQAIASSRNKARGRELARIEAALRRLSTAPDSFGLCSQCEEPIAPARLRLAPWVERCVGCQAAQDVPRAGARRRHLTDFADD